MNILRYATVNVFLFAAFAFSVIPQRAIEFSMPLYRFSYSEEFENPLYRNVLVFGKPRSDEYGSTIGAEFTYKHFNPNSRLSFDVKLNYARSISHTYDGSLQGQVYDIKDTSDLFWYYRCIIYEPWIQETNNYFYGANVKFGWLASNNYSRIVFEPKIAATINGWTRPVNLFSEYYYWFRIRPGMSITTKNSQNLGIFSELSLSIPIWQTMILDWYGERYKFYIKGKVGWQFESGFLKYLQRNRVLRITYFYEYYGFKESPLVEIRGLGSAYEPSSNTNNHGVKLSLIFGIGGK